MSEELTLLKAQLKDANKQAQDLAERVAAIEYEQAVEKRKPFRILAHEMHEAMCERDHTEYCAYGYEIRSEDEDSTWNGWTHKRYLTAVEESCNEMKLTPDEMLSALQDYKKFRKKHGSFLAFQRRVRHNA